jgi:uncharacterized OB-fold protein
MPRPAPRPTRNSGFFWEGCERGVLMGQRCPSCDVFLHPPRPMCPHCHGLEREYVELSGRGTVHSFMKPVHPQLPMFEEGYLCALIDLEEGIRLLSNLTGVTLDEIEIGMPVEVHFVPTADGKAVHQFRPADAGKGRS